MDEFNNQLSALTCELDQLYLQLGFGIHNDEEQEEIQQRIQEIQHQIHTAIDQEVDV